MMTLNEYLSTRRKSEFAEQIGVSASQLSQYLSAYRRPSYDMMIKIRDASGGLVSVESWDHIESRGDDAADNQEARQ